MKNRTLNVISLTFSIILLSKVAVGQVGINTTDPKGIIDFNSTTHGVVYPNVALNATDDPDPVVNPQGGALAIGTVVYNTNTTNNGNTTDVQPGVYVWDGTQWMVHFKKRQSELYEQTAVLRTESNFVGGYQDIPGLGVSDNNMFTANYSGLYRVELKSNFGGGRTSTNGNSFVSMAEGEFRFLFDGTPYTYETSSFSAHTNYINSGTYYEDVWKESYRTIYLNLTAGTSYPFSMTFDAYDAPGFLGNGASANSNVNLVNQNFTSYTVTQTNTSAGCGGGGSTNGWVVAAGNCAGCVGNSLYANSNRNGCAQNATARMAFTPTVTTVNISFDYELDYRGSALESLRVYLHNGVTQVGGNLINISNTDLDSSYNGTVTLAAGTAHTLRFEYITSGRGNDASIDNVVISEASGPLITTGRGYIGTEIPCQIEFTYIGE